MIRNPSEECSSAKGFFREDSDIDIAFICAKQVHLVASQGLGIPQSSRDAFDFLQQAGIIDEHLVQKLKAMVGISNIAVHNYQAVNLDIVQGLSTRTLMIS
ncbi:HepT-like ribonuclease domain-containing protein [Desulfosporosinus sp. OT]|uniref:type VII toxin-antitoxin system HepT family RNase toxin n=1 Tax=Desulfosporosinus sp. OT TaxID=913865 RepID=UPI000223A0E4|nr:HepT-like ribonuclease domain-containing protein [Desulfosporosinus sp. OT]EGW41423.1 hypothetical protein DOT_0612 [Desulfosporosinus sp. OT]